MRTVKSVLPPSSSAGIACNRRVEAAEAAEVISAAPGDDAIRRISLARLVLSKTKLERTCSVVFGRTIARGMPGVLLLRSDARGLAGANSL